jgi:shikimate 5-dehydrogenase
MQHSRPPISGRTRLYGLFAAPVDHLQTPGVLNALLGQRGVDAVFVPLHVTAEHFATTVAGAAVERGDEACGLDFSAVQVTMARHRYRCAPGASPRGKPRGVQVGMC